jgi:catechol 2,3-dioxygenase-like lactoylglutathione lyase family enzyme
MGSTVGQFCIAVNDLEESVRFYTEIMGLVEHGRTEIPTMTPQPIDHGRALWKIYIYVDDAVATWEKAVAAGYESHMKPERLERWPVIVGFISDPDGYLIEIIESEGPRPGH